MAAQSREADSGLVVELSSVIDLSVQAERINPAIKKLNNFFIGVGLG
jgi:hypothetical protein